VELLWSEEREVCTFRAVLAGAFPTNYEPAASSSGTALQPVIFPAAAR